VIVDGERARAAAESAARRSYGKLVAYLASRSRDVASAEDALSAAFEAALQRWPEQGIPASPEAWLLTVARHHAIDAARRRQVREAAEPDLVLLTTLSHEEEPPRVIPDDRLLLMFACAHPAIEAAARAPLMLQTILGFDAASIASAFLVSPTAMGQRLWRAKTKIKQAGIPWRLPDRDDLPDRLDSVLTAIYAAYTQACADAALTHARGAALAQDCLWMGELVVALLPQAPEALGLLALMLHTQARRDARRDARGNYVPLDRQVTAAWDSALIERAETVLHRAGQLQRPGRFQLEAALQSVHAARHRTGRTDWTAVVQLYDALWTVTGSPVVAINRAAAIGQARGAADGLAALAALSDDPRLVEYQPYWATRAALLAATGAVEAADAAYHRAIALQSDPTVRRFLESQRAALPAR